MPAWPWPEAEIHYLADRAFALLGESPHTLASVAALLEVLRDFGDPADARHADVPDVRKWAKRQTTARLTRWLAAAEALHVASAAAGQPHRRGDLIRITGKPWGPTWRDMRQR